MKEPNQKLLQEPGLEEVLLSIRQLLVSEPTDPVSGPQEKIYRLTRSKENVAPKLSNPDILSNVAPKSSNADLISKEVQAWLEHHAPDLVEKAVKTLLAQAFSNSKRGS
jgi:hypothetical protein